MEDAPGKKLLVHPTAIPAKWRELADVLADMTESEARTAIHDIQTRAWWAGWSNVRPPDLSVHILGTPLTAATCDVLDWDLVVIEDTIQRAYTRPHTAVFTRDSEAL